MHQDLVKPDAGGPVRQLDAKDIARTPKPRQWIGTIIVLLLASMFVHMLVTNVNLQWNVVGHYLFSHTILSGIGLTLELTVLAMLAGLVIGIVVAVMRLSGNVLMQRVSWAWIWFFRGVPPLVQLIFWYNLASLVHSVRSACRTGPRSSPGRPTASSPRSPPRCSAWPSPRAPTQRR